MNDKKIEVTVSIITYCHEKYIRQCLDSVFAQETTFDFEVIVAEDASPDNTREILLEYKKKYGDKLILILHDKNLGPSGNNASINPYIRGEFIAIVEGDDFWIDKYKLQKQYDILKNHPEYSAVCCDFMTVNSTGKTIKKNNLCLQNSIVKTIDNWLNESYSLHTCTIFHRRIYPYNDQRYINLRQCAPTMGDIISFSLLYDYGPIYVLKDVMAAHREAGSEDVTSYSMKSQRDPLKYTRMFIDIFTNIEKYMNNKYDFTKRKCIKIAYVIVGKILGKYKYDKREMKEIESKFSLKWRIYIHIKTILILLQLGKEKTVQKWGIK